MPPIFDLHAHPSFRAFNDRGENDEIPDPNIWVKRIPSDEDEVFIFDLLKQFGIQVGSVFLSQVNLEAAVKGKLECICAALYPLERGFIKRGSNQEDIGIANTDVGNFDRIIAYLTGFHVDRINELQTFSTSYFQQLKQEYKYLKKTQNITDYSNHTYELVNSYDELEAARQRSTDAKKVLPLILSLEGAHAFASDIYKTDDGYKAIDTTENGKPVFEGTLIEGELVDMVKAEKEGNQEAFLAFQKQLLANVWHVKTMWETPPFFVTFSHHFYNHLAGHAETFKIELSQIPILGSVINATIGSLANKWLLDQKGKIDGTKYFNLGITDFGKEVIKRLLMTDGTHRSILIDVKHMSAQARVDYYKMLREDYGDKRIPIIFSHGAVNGRKKLKDYKKDKPKKRKSTFNTGNINMFDDEINTIIESDGLMGIMIDERRIIGRKLPKDTTISMKKYKKLKKKRKGRKTQEEKNIEKKTCLSLIFNQIFHIIEVYEGLNQEDAWNHICLGSDYEGLINPVDLVAQLVEHNLAKVGVASSNLVFRS